MSKNLRLDHDAVQSARKHKDPPPRFHYEDRSFTIVEWVIDILVSHNGAKVHVILSAQNDDVNIGFFIL